MGSVWLKEKGCLCVWKRIWEGPGQQPLSVGATLKGIFSLGSTPLANLWLTQSLETFTVAQWGWGCSLAMWMGAFVQQRGPNFPLESDKRNS